MAAIEPIHFFCINGMAQPRIFLVDGPAVLVAGHEMGLVNETEIVAVSAGGMAACENAGLRYRCLDSWCAPQEIADLGRRNYRELDKFCTVADAMLRERIPELACRNLFPVRYSYFFAKIAMDSVSTKILMLSRMLDALKPAQLIGRARTAPLAADSMPAFDKNTNLMAEILKRIPLADGVERRWLQTTPNIKHTSQPKSSTDYFTSSMASMATLPTRAVRGLKALPQRWRRGARTFLLFNLGHDISYVLPFLAACGLRPVYPVAPVNSFDAIGVDWDQLLGADYMAKTFFASGHSYVPLMIDYFFRPLANRLAAAVAAYDSSAKQVRVERPEFALTGTINVALSERSMMAAAQHAGVPLITYQEGAGYGSIVTPIYDHTEVRDGDLLLTYGEGNAEHFAQRKWPTKPFRAVGSAHQDSIRLSLQHKQRAAMPRPFTVMYVGTAVDANIMHCPENGLVDTFYFRSQLRIFDTLRRLPNDVRVIAKLHSGDLASRALLSDPAYQRISIELAPLEEVLDQADCFVLDFPSTTLLSCCLTQASIFLVAEPGVTDLTSSQESRLRPRVHLFRSVEDLSEALCAWIASDVTARNTDGKDLNDDTYLRAYAIHEADGNSAERAAEVLGALADMSVSMPAAQSAPQ